tara:strand:+ start:328 stop:648 length:321 start_codon:yes stop_codon:yes gene_type:complete
MADPQTPVPGFAPETQAILDKVTSRIRRYLEIFGPQGDEAYPALGAAKNVMEEQPSPPPPAEPPAPEPLPGAPVGTETEADRRLKAASSALANQRKLRDNISKETF